MTAFDAAVAGCKSPLHTFYMTPTFNGLQNNDKG